MEVALHQRLRVGGDVRNGSIQHYSGRIDFRVGRTGENSPGQLCRKPIHCPILSKDGRGNAWWREKVQPDGRFVAETVQAKCRV